LLVDCGCNEELILDVDKVLAVFNSLDVGIGNGVLDDSVSNELAVATLRNPTRNEQKELSHLSPSVADSALRAVRIQGYEVKRKNYTQSLRLNVGQC
jgi:hypothetical protein